MSVHFLLMTAAGGEHPICGRGGQHVQPHPSHRYRDTDLGLHGGRHGILQ